MDTLLQITLEVESEQLAVQEHFRTWYAGTDYKKFRKMSKEVAKCDRCNGLRSEYVKQLDVDGKWFWITCRICKGTGTK